MGLFRRKRSRKARSFRRRTRNRASRRQRRGGGYYDDMLEELEDRISFDIQFPEKYTPAEAKKIQNVFDKIKNAPPEFKDRIETVAKNIERLNEGMS